MSMTKKQTAHFRKHQEVPMREPHYNKPPKMRPYVPVSERANNIEEQIKAMPHDELVEACLIWKDAVVELGKANKEIKALKEQAKMPAQNEADKKMIENLQADVAEMRGTLEAASVLERSLVETRDVALKRIADLEAQLKEADENQKYDIKALLVENVKLKNQLLDITQHVSDLEKIQTAAVAKNVNYWHYIKHGHNNKMPAAGARVMCLCVDVKDFADKLAGRRFKELGQAFYKILFYLGQNKWQGLPSGIIVVAWRPEIAHDREKINITIMDTIMESLNDSKIFNSLFVDAARHLRNADEEQKRLAKLKKDLRSVTNKKIAQIFDYNNKLARSVMEDIIKVKKNDI